MKQALRLEWNIFWGSQNFFSKIMWVWPGRGSNESNYKGLTLMGLIFSINSPEVPKSKHIVRKVRNFERSENCESSRELCWDVWQHWPCWHAGHAGSCTKFALCEVRAMRYFATSELEKDTPYWILRIEIFLKKFEKKLGWGGTVGPTRPLSGPSKKGQKCKK